MSARGSLGRRRSGSSAWRSTPTRRRTAIGPAPASSSCSATRRGTSSRAAAGSGSPARRPGRWPISWRDATAERRRVRADVRAHRDAGRARAGGSKRGGRTCGDALRTLRLASARASPSWWWRRWRCSASAPTRPSSPWWTRRCQRRCPIRTPIASWWPTIWRRRRSCGGATRATRSRRWPRGTGGRSPSPAATGPSGSTGPSSTPSSSRCCA